MKRSHKKVKLKEKSTSPPSSSIQSPHSFGQSSMETEDDERGETAAPFQIGTKIYENETLEANVIKEMYKKNKVFCLDDHLFVAKIKLKKNKPPPLLSEVVDVIESIFKFMLDHLRNFYKAEDRNLVYMTVFQKRDMATAMNSPAFELQSTTTDEITHHLMTMFNRFVNSNKEIRLDSESFTIHFDVLSMDHVNSTFHRRGKQKKKKTYGCRKIISDFRKRPGKNSITVIHFNW